MGPTLVLGVWRCAVAMPGALCVMTFGMLLMLVWFADSLDSPDTVSVYSAIAQIAMLFYMHVLKMTLSFVFDRKYM